MNGSTFREIATSEREHMIICIFMPRLRHILTFVCDFVLSTTASAGNPKWFVRGQPRTGKCWAELGPSGWMREGLYEREKGMWREILQEYLLRKP
jgi:hypothetical protein